MTRKLTIATMGACLAVAFWSGDASARGFGGGGARGGGGFGGGGGYRGGGAGYGGMRSGGMPSYSRTPSFSTMDRGGYGGFGNAGGAGYGARSGSYTTNRGGTVNHGAAGAGVRGPYGGAAGRGIGGVQATTAGGRSFTDVGRAGGAVGPYGNAVGTRSNLGVASGSRGTVAAESRTTTAIGAGRAARVGEHRAAGFGPGGVVASRSLGASAFRPYGYNSFGAYHSGWVHGYWNGHSYGGWGWRNPYWAGWGVGAGLGWGLSAWGFGSALYGMGYMPYSNPYYYAAPVAVVNQPVVAGAYDYSQPIDTLSPAPDEAVADPAMAAFDTARDAFRQGAYDQALKLVGDALTTAPNDTALHEFRGLCLFALGRYDDAAAALYAVLSVGPGWDWTTLISLYPGPEPYTAQLRALESNCNANPNSAAARFVLAYHYLTEGHADAAVEVYRQVVKLMPSDTLSARLLRQLDPSTDPAPTGPAPAPVTADTVLPTGATIDGTWTARPAPDASINLTIQPAGTFTWQVTQKGQTQSFGGSSTYGEGLLTLAQDKGPVLVGRVSWTDPAHMTFRIAGDGPDDPGLSFSK